ncbi:hypothetical protein [Pseudarthrobacter sp. NamE5]|uniref:hypothetical protein n=1 Tax=Pseudarthrobacter sp. NamE5 TaxID=2576839 RepID=UPI00110A8A56|nr:hypothetical protein [Pseudarthrobacter sp. NamE5]TLM80820.1 hypothetical protein FDW84_18385 [Pseudarthrobacter sp. NamE5]
MIESTAFVIRASGHAVDFVVAPFPPADPVTALQASMRGERQETPLRVPLVSTGVHSGPIDLTVEVLEARPETSSPDWEDIHEVSLMLPGGRAFFSEPTGWEIKDIGTITGNDRGSYRARLHATGRDTAFDLVVESPVERHLVQFWKEPPSPVSVLSSKSEQGNSLPGFIKMWQGQEPPTATAHAGPQLITQDSPPPVVIISAEAGERARHAFKSTALRSPASTSRSRPASRSLSTSAKGGAARLAVTRDRVDISYRFYSLVDDHITAIPSPQQLKDCNGLVCPLEAGAVVITGTDTGFITVGVSLLDSEPEFSLDGWEEAVDVSIHSPTGQLAVGGFNDTPSLPELSTAGPGWYRIRCMARGRVSEFQTISLESTEEHLLLVWPAPPAPEKVHHVAFRFGELPTNPGAAEH